MEKVKYLDLLARNGIDSAHPGGFSMTKFLLRQEKLTPEMVLLDVGCGTGQTSAYIATHYPCKVIAVDINSQMLEKARQKFAANKLNITVIQADAMKLPFPKNSFDITLSESVTAFTQISKTLREYYRVLKPGGILLAIEVTALEALTLNEAADLQAVLGITRFPTSPEWCEMFRAGGFNEIQVLYRKRLNLMETFTPERYKVFHDYANTMFRHRKKVGFGVYRCKL